MTVHPAEPLISVALCTYNGARYLREQLDSLLTQTYRHIEIVAVDDASTDQTIAILREYERRDPRLRVSVNAVNAGVKENFERAMSLCAGSFIAPCDQDDIWLPEKLEVLLDVIGNSALAYCDSSVMDEQGRVQRSTMSSLCNMISGEDTLPFAYGNCVSGHAMLFRRELIQLAPPFPDCFYYDWWLAAVAASNGGIVYCDRRLVNYRFHSGSVMNALRAPAKRPGRRAERLREFGRRLRRLSALPGADRVVLAHMADLWEAREKQWFSFALARLMYRHWWRIYAIRRSRWRMLPALKFALGSRLQRMVNPAAYEGG